MEPIFARRSIRKYTSKSVPQDLIEKIIRAGMAAPSAGNEQPWHFIVINDKAILNEIPKFHKYARMLTEANHAIVVCGDISLEKYIGYWVQDCSAASQNMFLMAHELGLGSVWVGVYPNMDEVEPLKKLLGLPDSVIPLSILPIGYPADSKEPSNRFDATRIHYDRW